MDSKEVTANEKKPDIRLPPRDLAYRILKERSAQIKSGEQRLPAQDYRRVVCSSDRESDSEL